MIIESQTSNETIARHWDVFGYIVGEEVITNAPGKTGNNYARWTISERLEDDFSNNFAPYRFRLTRQQ